MTESTLTAIDSLLDAIALEYEKATPEQREAMSPFCKFFFELEKRRVVKDAETETPQYFKNTEAAVTVVKLTPTLAPARAMVANQ